MEFTKSVFDIFSFLKPRNSSDIREDHHNHHGHPRAVRSPHSPYTQARVYGRPSLDLLSPPIPEDDLLNESPPFIPLGSDKISLSMAQPRSSIATNRRKAMRTSLEATKIDCPIFSSDAPGHTTPNFKVMHWLENSPDISTMKPRTPALQRQSQTFKAKSISQGKPRRWTVPSKALPSQRVFGIPNRGAAWEKKPVRSRFSNASDLGELQNRLKAQSFEFKPGTFSFYSPDTPAMITLRRATEKYSIDMYNDQQKRDRAIGSTRSMMFRPFFHTDKHPLEVQSNGGQYPSRHGSSQLKVCSDDNQAFPCWQGAATPVFTEASVIPSLAGTLSSSLVNDTERRSSTRIISGTSVHEIIWENDCRSRQVSTSTEANLPIISSTGAWLTDGARRDVAINRLQSRLKQSGQIQTLPDVDNSRAQGPILSGLFNWTWKRND